MNAKTLSLIVVASFATALLGCQGCAGNGGSADTNATDSHTQGSGSDTGSETQSATTATDTDGTGSGETATDTSTQSETPSSSGTDDTTTTDTGSVTSSASDTDSDTWPLPDGCEVVSLSNSITWEGARAIDGNRMVWSEYNYVKAVPELKLRHLDSGEVTVLISDATWEFRQAISGDRVFWDEELTTGDWTTREVYSLDLTNQVKQRLSNDACADLNGRGGSSMLVHTKVCNEDGIEALYYTNLTTLESHEIVPDAVAPPGGAGMAFDGERYVAWGWYDVNQSEHQFQMWLFDIQNPGVPPFVAYPETNAQISPVLHNGKLLAATSTASVSTWMDLWSYDIESKTMAWLSHEPYDQIPGDAAGFVLAYQDTQETGDGIYLNGGKSHVMLRDLETGTVRKVTQVIDQYSQLGMSGQYLAFLVRLGGNAGALVACDLKAAGFMGEDGHLLPD